MNERQTNKENKQDIKDITNEINSKKNISDKQEIAINNVIFKNIVISVCIAIFIILLILGAQNIESDIYLTDLKVFTISFAILTVLLFECSYRKESAELCLHGIESFFITLVTMLSIYNYKLYIDQYSRLLALSEFLFAIYYSAKSIIIYIKMKKKFKNSQNDISEIIKK